MIKHHVSPAQFENLPQQSIRDAFGQALVELGSTTPHVVALSADLSDSVRMNDFAAAFPDRYFEVGVAEQNLIGISAGLAKEGLHVFAGSFAAFSPGRSFDQIRNSLCYAPRSVVVVGGHGGLSVGQDGATHQMLEDISLMRSLPNMTVTVGCDAQSTFALTQQLGQLSTPAYLRLSRIKVRDIIPAQLVQVGQAVELRSGTDVALLATGIMVERALSVAYTLAEHYSISASVIAFPTIKPLDEAAIQHAARTTGRIVTLEEHQTQGGFGSAVAEYVVQNDPIPMQLIGVNDTFGESGTAEQVLAKYGLDEKTILHRVRQFVA